MATSPRTPALRGAVVPNTTPSRATEGLSTSAAGGAAAQLNALPTGGDQKPSHPHPYATSEQAASPRTLDIQKRKRKRRFGTQVDRDRGRQTSAALVHAERRRDPNPVREHPRRAPLLPETSRRPRRERLSGTSPEQRRNPRRRQGPSGRGAGRKRAPGLEPLEHREAPMSLRERGPTGPGLGGRVARQPEAQGEAQRKHRDRRRYRTPESLPQHLRPRQPQAQCEQSVEDRPSRTDRG